MCFNWKNRLRCMHAHNERILRATNTHMHTLSSRRWKRRTSLCMKRLLCTNSLKALVLFEFMHMSVCECMLDVCVQPYTLCALHDYCTSRTAAIIEFDAVWFSFPLKFTMRFAYARQQPLFSLLAYRQIVCQVLSLFRYCSYCYFSYYRIQRESKFPISGVYQVYMCSFYFAPDFVNQLECLQRFKIKRKILCLCELKK